MTYLTDTVLERKQPEGDSYDVVRVVGVDPTKYAETAAEGEWVGSGGNRVLVVPHEEFGPTESVPEGKLNAEYNVRFEPDLQKPGVMPARVSSTGGSAPREPTPEETFGTPASSLGGDPAPPQPTPEAALAEDAGERFTIATPPVDESA